MKAFSSLAIACAIAASASTTLAQDYGKQIFPFSIRDGETQVIRRVTSTTHNCEPMFKKLAGIDVMEGPPELSFKAEEQQVRTSVAGKDCPKPVPVRGLHVDP